MFPVIWRVLRSSLAITLAAYALGVCLTGAVAAVGAYRVASAVFSDMRAGASSPETNKKPSPILAQRLPERATSVIWAPSKSGMREPSSRAKPAVFGTSSRYSGRSRSRDEDEDSWDRDDDDDGGESRQSYGTYRTLCVRLCDGYYFPISFSASRSRFERDAQACERSCPGQAQLFVHPNPDGEVEDMVDLRGRPYRELKTAFLYRAQYMPACRCKAEPWESEAKAQHRIYALEAAARKGDKQARTELAELTAKMQRNMKQGTPGAGVTPATSASTDAPVADASRREEADSERMGLGARARARPPARRESDWMARALGRP